MKLIAIKALDGSVRYKTSPARLKPGDVALGAVNYEDIKNLGNPPISTKSHPVNELQVELVKAGIPWGDAIAWATKSIGIEGCEACKSNQALYNQSFKLGLKETIRRIKEYGSRSTSK